MIYRILASLIFSFSLVAGVAGNATADTKSSSAARNLPNNNWSPK